MPSINSVVLMGRLTADPELKQTPSGTSVSSFTLAVDRKFLSADGAKQTDFIPVAAWRHTAEFICRNFIKGALMIVEGEIQTRSWTDKQGVKRYATEVVVADARFGETKVRAEENNASASQSGSQKDFLSSYAADDTPNFTSIDADEYLPF